MEKPLRTMARRRPTIFLAGGRVGARVKGASSGTDERATRCDRRLIERCSSVGPIGD